MYIAVDSGIRTADALGVVPQICLGDFDSFPEADLPTGVIILRHPAKKDSTDLQLAVKYALDEGCGNITIIGGLGGRLDHTLVNLSLLRVIERNGVHAIITDGFNEIFYLCGKVSIKKLYKYVSIIPLSETLSGVSMRGFVYPLEDTEVSRDNIYTSSNEISEDAEFGEISIGSGEALICLCDDAKGFGIL
ncbi:thiamine pyrophosphokinase [Clostridia bacterium]|nr:thiamine pyrophosphokinase [Clostridia bacterium]